jgi:hypothetical protein
MNCLKHDPEILIKRVDSTIRDTNYNFLDLLKEYNLPENIYYDYLSCIDEFKLKNVWNHIIKRWNHMKLTLKDNIDFKSSEYCKGEYHQIHNDINDIVLNELLLKFIMNSHIRCFFVANCIQNYIYPK